MTFLIILTCVLAWLAAGHFIGKKAAPIAYQNQVNALQKNPYSVDTPEGNAKATYFACLVFSILMLMYLMTNNTVVKVVPELQAKELERKRKELEQARVEIDRQHRRLGIRPIDWSADETLIHPVSKSF